MSAGQLRAVQALCAVAIVAAYLLYLKRSEDRARRVDGALLSAYIDRDVREVKGDKP